MSIVRTFLGKDFDEHKLNGERSQFAGGPLSTCDRDELLAVIGFLGREKQAMQEMYERTIEFQREIRKARYW